MGKEQFFQLRHEQGGRQLASSEQMLFLFFSLGYGAQPHDDPLPLTFCSKV
jgi:hypothetical protein